MFRKLILRTSRLVTRTRQLAVFALLCTLIASFGHQAIKGNHGLERRAQIKQRIAEMEAERNRLADKRVGLEREVDLLRAAQTQRTDFAEQRARGLLNLATPTEIIIVDLPARR